jgi:hypothetical protein
VSARKPDESRPAPPIVRVAPLQELRVYQISESELEKLERGSPESIHLSLALAFLPAALTLLITLQTVDITKPRIYNAYLFSFLLLALQGGVSLIRWWRARGTVRDIVQEIRDRMPKRPGIPEQATEGSQSEEPPASPASEST